MRASALSARLPTLDHVAKTCRYCGIELDGRRREWCSDAHRFRGRRRLARGLPANSHPAGGHRGPVPMGQKTRLEQALDAARRDAIANASVADITERVLEIAAAKKGITR